MSKSFTITIDRNGNAEIDLKSYEAESPKIAKAIEKALGGGVYTPDTVKWEPKAHTHAHVHAGGHKH